MPSPAAAALLLHGLCFAATPGLDTAREHLKALRYAEAATALTQVAQQDDLSRADAVEYFMLEGLVRASLNDAVSARRAFTQALAIDPDAKLPGKVSPRVSTPFQEARDWVTEHGALGLELETRERTGTADWKLTFKPLRDEGALVKEVRFFLVEDGVRRELGVVPADVRTLSPRGREATVSWVLLGTHRWVLGEGGPVALKVEEGSAPVVEAPRPPVASLLPKETTTVRQFSIVPGIVCLSAAGVAVAVGWFLLFNTSNIDYALPGWISGLVLAGAGIGLVIASNRSVTTQVSFMLAPNSGMAVVRGTF